MKCGMICIFILAIQLFGPCSSASSLHDLNGLISSFEYSRISVRDLAFYLVSHDFDATPEDGYVLVWLDGTAYRLDPNGEGAGLCDISLLPPKG